MMAKQEPKQHNRLLRLLYRHQSEGQRNSHSSGGKVNTFPFVQARSSLLTHSKVIHRLSLKDKNQKVVLQTASCT